MVKIVSFSNISVNEVGVLAVLAATPIKAIEPVAEVLIAGAKVVVEASMDVVTELEVQIVVTGADETVALVIEEEEEVALLEV